MEPFLDYSDYDAVGLGELVARQDVHPSELVEAAAEHIEASNGTINAVVRTEFDKARDTAASLDVSGPLAGVPFLIKDLFIRKGERVSFGSVLFRSFVADVPSPLGDRMDRAGLISLGRTNSSEFGLLPTSEPVLNGPTRNPWNLDHSAGGSSGGAAAAVAAGMVPLAHGSDGGGSIRIPASNCGLFGLKPSRGRMPVAHQIGIDLGVSRSVRDSAALLDAAHGTIPGDAYWAPSPDQPFSSAVVVDPPPLKIAYSVADFRGNSPDPSVRDAILDTAKLLESLGHTVVEALPPLNGEEMADAFLDVWAALVADVMKVILGVASEKAIVRRLRPILGDLRTMKVIGWADSRDSGLPALEPFTWALAKRALGRDPGDLRSSERVLAMMSYETGSFLEEYDMLLTPVLGSPAVPLGYFDQTKDFDLLIEELISYVAYTPLANFSGMPAMSVPLGFSDDGLPIGSHFLGRFGDEAMLLKLAGQLERAQPWAGKRPDASLWS